MRRHLLCAVMGMGVVALFAVSTPGQGQSAARAAAQGPEPREIPVPRIAGPLGTLPGANAVPTRTAMPDVLVMEDGTRAAAFDDRLMGSPVVTGGGGVGAYRFAGPRGSETLDIMERKYPNWFSPNLHEFRGQREKQPFDQHNQASPTGV